MAIKPPSSSTSINSNQATLSSAKPTTAATPQSAPANVVNPEAVAKALKEYNQLNSKLKKPFTRGAAALFAENVVFPADLLDSDNPANDVKYLHLLCSVFGLKELERYFGYLNQSDDEEEDNSSSESEDQNKDS